MGKLIIPCITPFHNGFFDIKSFRKLMKYTRNSGYDGVFVLGSTGGFAALDFKLHRKLIHTMYSEIPDDLEKYVGISRSNLPETLELLREAEKTGFQKLVAINPFYHRYSGASIVRFFSRIAASVRSDLFLYNNPSLSGFNISPELIEELAKKYESIRGIKDSSGDMEQFSQLLRLQDMEVFQGKDILLWDSVRKGAAGGVCSSSNFSLNALNIAKGRNNTIEAKIKMENLMKIVSSYDIPAVHHYLFRRIILGDPEPQNYMFEPFLDLQNFHSLDRIMELIELPDNI